MRIAQLPKMVCVGVCVRVDICVSMSVPASLCIRVVCEEWGGQRKGEGCGGGWPGGAEGQRGLWHACT